MTRRVLLVICVALLGTRAAPASTLVEPVVDSVGMRT